MFALITLFVAFSYAAVFDVHLNWQSNGNPGVSAGWTCLRFIPSSLTIVQGDQVRIVMDSGVDNVVFSPAVPPTAAGFGVSTTLDPTYGTLKYYPAGQTIMPAAPPFIQPVYSTSTDVNAQAVTSSGAIGNATASAYANGLPALTAAQAAPSGLAGNLGLIPGGYTFNFPTPGTFIGYSMNTLNVVKVKVLPTGQTAPLTGAAYDAVYTGQIGAMLGRIAGLEAQLNFTTLPTPVFNNFTKTNEWPLYVGYNDFAFGLYYNGFYPLGGAITVETYDVVKIHPAYVVPPNPAVNFAGTWVTHALSINGTTTTAAYPLMFNPYEYENGPGAPSYRVHKFARNPIGNPRNFDGTFLLSAGLFSPQSYPFGSFDITFSASGTFTINEPFQLFSTTITVSATTQRPVGYIPPAAWTREYRLFNGYGNNPSNPFYGGAYEPFVRLDVPTNNFIGTTVTASGRVETIDPSLPNARTVSNNMAAAGYDGKPYAENFVNQLHTEFSQFMIADMTNTDTSHFYGASCIPAVDPNDFWIDTNNWVYAPPGPYNTAPFPNPVGWGPANYSLKTFNPGFDDPADLVQPTRTQVNFPELDGRYCHAFDYSFSANYDGLNEIPVGSPRSAVNTQTAWIDLSNLYAPDHVAAGGLVDRTTGKLVFPTQYILPVFPSLIFGDPNGAVGGDYRINKTPGLRAMWDLLQRLHNYFVDQFAATNPEYTPYMRYQEARRMNIAVFQSHVVREYLASTVGQPLPAYLNTTYSGVNPGIESTFSHAIGRYGHTLVTNTQERLDDSLNPCVGGYIHTYQNYYNPSNWMYNGTFTWECAFRGWANTLSAKFDVGVADALRNLFFARGGTRGGYDLMVFNIQRSRQLGVPLLNVVRTSLGLPAHTWSTISSDPAVVQMLQNTYNNSIDAVEAIVGAFAEDPFEDALVGETTRAVLLAQFGRIRDGDRLWFEATDQFTTAEIEVVHGLKYATLIPVVYPSIKNTATIPKSIFFVSSRQLIPTIQGVSGTQSFYPQPPALTTGSGTLPWTTIDLAPFYRLNWALDRPADRAYFHVQVQIDSGWVGLGWSPAQLNTMKGADIAFCSFINGTGPFRCLNSYAFDVGPPTPDPVQSDANMQTHYVNISNGITSVTFSRPMSAFDAAVDKPITNNQQIIFAFNPQTYQYIYHGPTRSSSTTINFISDYKGPYTEQPQELWILIILYIWSAIGIILSLIIMVLVILKRPYFIFQTPEFCLVILFGSICCYISVILLLPTVLTDGMCFAHLWLFCMGFWFVYVGIMLKNFRVFLVFSRAQKMKVTRVTWKDLIIPMLICVFLEIIFQVCWDAIPAIRPYLSYYQNNEQRTYTVYCAGNKWMWLGAVLVRVVVLILSAILAYLSRGLKKEQNYSRETAFAIYTAMIILIVAIPIGYAIPDSPVLVVLLKGIAICLGIMMTIIITFFDPVRRIITGREARKFQSSGVSGLGSAGTSTKLSTGSAQLDSSGGTDSKL